MTRHVAAIFLSVFIAFSQAVTANAQGSVRSTLLSIAEAKGRSEMVVLHFRGSAPIYTASRQSDGSMSIRLSETITAPTLPTVLALKNGSHFVQASAGNAVELSLSALRLPTFQITVRGGDMILALADANQRPGPASPPSSLRRAGSSAIAPHLLPTFFAAEAARLFSLENHLGPNSSTHHDTKASVLSTSATSVVVNGHVVAAVEVDLISHNSTVESNVPMTVVQSYALDRSSGAFLSSSSRLATQQEAAAFHLPQNPA
jgi:hypothetical protein